MSSNEEWRPVIGWGDLYEVSSLGRVRSLDRVVHDLSRGGSPRARVIKGRALKCYRHTFGYLQLRLCRSGVNVPVYVHHLVAEAFLGPRPVGMEVAHNDGNPANSAASNLRYDTPKNNTSDQIRHGTRKVGTQKRNSKLNDELVREIRATQGVSQHELARRYGVSQSQIYCVKNRLTWAHVT